MLAGGFGFWMWRLTLARCVLFLMSAEYSAVMPALLDTDQCHSNSERSTVLLCCQLKTDFNNISIV